MLAGAGGFVGFAFGSLLSFLIELRDKRFRTSAQVQEHMGSVAVSATPRAVGRYRKSPADIIVNDNRSAFAEAFRVSWAKIHFAVAHPKSVVVNARGPGIALGITSAASGEGKSVHALALARTAALTGEKVVLVDADLRRSGVSRLIKQDFCFTLRDFLDERCAADDAIVIEGSSGVHFVPGASSDIAWSTRDLRRFFEFIDYLKQRYALVIIDLPPVVGLAETIRLAPAADHIALVIRWGRTERQFVQFALDILRSASISMIAVILNDIDLKSQRRRGYRDHTQVYTDKGLYRVESKYREPTTHRRHCPSQLPGKKQVPRRTDPSRSVTIRIAIDHVLRDRISRDCTIDIMISVSRYGADQRMLAATLDASARQTNELDRSATRVDIALLVSALFLQRFSLTFGKIFLELDLVPVAFILLCQFVFGKVIIQYDRLLWFLAAVVGGHLFFALGFRRHRRHELLSSLHRVLFAAHIHPTDRPCSIQKHASRISISRGTFIVHRDCTIFRTIRIGRKKAYNVLWYYSRFSVRIPICRRGEYGSCAVRRIAHSQEQRSLFRRTVEFFTNHGDWHTDRDFGI